MALLSKTSLVLIIFLSSGFLSVAICLYGFFYEKNSITLNKVMINNEHLESGKRHIKMIQFSDMHFKRNGAREKKVRKMINEQNPDIIFFTGDFFDSKKDMNDPIIFNKAIEYLGSLSFNDYFFFVLGEDESVHSDYLKKELADINIIVLDNELMSIAFDSALVNIVGITNETKNFDTYHKIANSKRSNLDRFNELIKHSELKQYQNYKYYLAGQYTLMWENYEITAEVEIPSEYDMFGLSFYSQLPLNINKSYFLELNPDTRTLCLKSFGQSDFKGKTCSDEIISSLKCYQMKINVRNASGFTNIKAKFWDSNEKEPDQWQIECRDLDENRSTRGTVGFSHFNGDLYDGIKDLQVRILGYENNSNMLNEGVKEIPYDLSRSGLIKEEWLGVREIRAVLKNRKKTGQPYLFEKRFVRMLKGESLHGFNIVLTHIPENISVLENNGMDLVLTGHTHGGQINIPFIDRCIHESYKGQLLKSGLMTFNGTQLYINRGIGTSIIPVRINCKPEVTLFELSNN